MDPFIVLGSTVVGVLVGLTGAGGGALMTPMLILLFGVTPSAAISSDLVAALVMRPVGAAVHLRRRTVNLRLAGWLSLGSIPAALIGAYALHELGAGPAAERGVQMLLGAALLAGALSMALRALLDRRSHRSRDVRATGLPVRPLPTVAVGVAGGLLVGMTSVGAGSLMIVLLLFVYPRIAARQLVGTDLTQAIPLTAAAALGALLFGHVDVPISASLVAGGVPGVLAGSLLSSRVSEGKLRPAIGIVILASGLKYVGAGAGLLGGSVVAALAVVALGRMWVARPATATT